MKKVFLTSLAVIGTVCAVLFAILMGLSAALNFSLAFLASALISYASFSAYKRLVNVQAPLQEPHDDDKEDDEDEKDEPKPSKAKVVAQTYKGFLSPLRLDAYVVLIASFLSLQNHGSLHVLPFLAGLAVVPLAALLSLLAKENSVEKNDN